MNCLNCFASCRCQADSGSQSTDGTSPVHVSSEGDFVIPSGCSQDHSPSTVSGGTTTTTAGTTQHHWHCVGVHKKLLSAPFWVEDKYRDDCCRCNQPFTMFWRRHHCRLCGDVFCGACTSHKLGNFKHTNWKLRVCDDCFVKYSTELMLHDVK